MKRIFVVNFNGGNFQLTGPEHSHLFTVLKVKAGERVTVLCGDEYDYTYEITAITNKSANLRFIDKRANDKNPEIPLTVYVALVKVDTLALIVQKLNELGVTEVIPFTSANSNLTPAAVNITKLNSIAQQSCKQCGRSKPLIVRGVLTFEQVCNGIKMFDKVLFANEGDRKHLIGEQALMARKKNIIMKNALIVGTAGGFLPYERERLCKLCTSVSLGKRILRSETAAIAAATIMMSKLGEI